MQARACAQACDRTLKAIAAAPVTVVVEYERGGGEGGGVYEVGRGVTPKRGPAVPKAAEATLRVVSFVAAIFCGDAPHRPRTLRVKGPCPLEARFATENRWWCRIRGRYGRAAQPGSPGSEE